MSRFRKSHPEQMQELVAQYRDDGQPWPTTSKNIARWLIKRNLWDRGNATVVEICARDIARSLRDEYYTDPQGRRVRTKHAAKVLLEDSQTQQMLWDDIRVAPREFMERAFKGRRNQIVGDCVQLNKDLSSVNENRWPKNPIPTLWDFTDDVIESEQAGDGKAAITSDVDEEFVLAHSPVKQDEAVSTLLTPPDDAHHRPIAH